MSKPEPGYRKITVCLPLGLVDDLEVLTSRLRVTRSAFLTSLLQGPVHDLVGLANMTVGLNADNLPDRIRRFRGESIAVVNSRVATFQASLHALEAFTGVAPPDTDSEGVVAKEPG